MGTKSSSPYPGKKQPSLAPRPKPKASGDGGGKARVTPTKEHCWDFQIVSATDAASQAKKDMSVDGIPQDSRVMIHADIGVLGYAPAGASKQMIATCRSTGGTLTGYVESVGSQQRVSIHLCVS